MKTLWSVGSNKIENRSTFTLFMDEIIYTYSIPSFVHRLEYQNPVISVAMASKKACKVFEYWSSIQMPLKFCTILLSSLQIMDWSNIWAMLASRTIFWISQGQLWHLDWQYKSCSKEKDIFAPKPTDHPLTNLKDK